MIEKFLKMSERRVLQSHKMSTWMRAQKTFCVCMCACCGGVVGGENILREGRIQVLGTVQVYWRRTRREEKIRITEKVFHSFLYPYVSVK